MLDHNTNLHPVLIRRTFDVAAINKIINDPAIFPHVAPFGSEPLDLSAIVYEPRNVVLACDGGIFLFGADAEPGIYEVHTSLLPGFHGRYALEAFAAAARWMFTTTDCWLILTRVPANNRPAALMARQVGFEPTFTRTAMWQTENGMVDVRFYELTYQNWLRLDRDFLIVAGMAFHLQLDEERKRHGFDEPHHPDEDCHDLHVGAACEMIRGGQPEKAVILYNRWARLAGYGQISLRSKTPLMFDIGDALLQMTDDDFKVILCRPQPQ